MGYVLLVAFFLFCIYMIFQSSRNQKRKYLLQKQQEHNQKQLAILSSISQRVRIITDCRNLITTSTNLETVKYRYGLAVKEIELLADDMKKLAPSDATRELTKDIDQLKQDFVDEEHSLIKQAVYNAFAAEMQEIAKLKTSAGKIKRQDRFYEKVCSIFPKQEPYIRDLVGYDIFGK